MNTTELVLYLVVAAAGFFLRHYGGNLPFVKGSGGKSPPSPPQPPGPILANLEPLLAALAEALRARLNPLAGEAPPAATPPATPVDPTVAAQLAHQKEVLATVKDMFAQLQPKEIK